MIFVGFCQIIVCQNIVVNDSYTAQQLVQNVLVNSPCATVSNFSVSGGNFNTTENSYAFFDGTNTIFPFQNGVILSTGKSINSQGPNTSLSDDGVGINWLGDTDLEIALGLSNSFNATVLEFDFVPLGNSISFDYIFSSEQYLSNPSSNQCNFTDGFAFLLKEVGTSNYSNLAVVPNTTIPVKVNTVRGNGTICPAANEFYFDAFNTAIYPTNFNGQTKIMKAKSVVTPGLFYHIKIVIADEGNARFDSAIFLGAGSFNSGVDLGVDRLLATNNPLCTNQNLPLNATIAGNNTYKWFKDGMQLIGETNPTYNVQNAGEYTVEVTLSGTSCVAMGKITIEYSSLPIIFNQTLVQCDDDNNGITTYNLTKLNALITNNDATLSNPIFYLNLSDALLQNNPITNPTSFQNITTNQVIAAVYNSYGCINYATVDLVISNNIITPLNSFVFCDQEDGIFDGFTAVNLSQDISPNVLLGLPSGLVISYYPSEIDAINETNLLPNNFTNSVIFQQTIFALIINGADCYGIIPIVIKIPVFNPTNLHDEIVFICKDNVLQLNVASGYTQYNWSTGEITNSIIVTTANNYTVTVTNNEGCTKIKKFTVIESVFPTITSIDVSDFSSQNNTVNINVSGSGNYEYSLDELSYQDSSLFTNVIAGEYFVYVRDKNGCGLASKKFYVIDYPKYFTPNGDGINDIWSLKGINKSSDNYIIYIFDRFGKIVKQLTTINDGWNGTVNNILLPADDYWFTIEFNNSRNVKGHFSLKR